MNAYKWLSVALARFAVFLLALYIQHEILSVIKEMVAKSKNGSHNNNYVNKEGGEK